MSRKVLVSGCFDLLHSGHVTFLQTAAAYGELYVALGSDATIHGLKGRPPVWTADERLHVVRALGCVKEAFISSGSGILDFAADLRRLRPNLFVVGADGHAPQKERLCRDLGIDYLVLAREPSPGLPARSTTSLRQIDRLPYRIDLAGGWLDQPFVSSLHPGPVLTISIEPTESFNERSGMATSTHNRALELWGPRLPAGEPEQLARVLFAYENPPGAVCVAGSQDAIGIVVPGLACSYYQGGYWPARIERIDDEDTLQMLEQALYLIPLGPRDNGYDPLRGQQLTVAGAQALAEAAAACWQALRKKDPRAFGEAVRKSFEAQVSLFPAMRTPAVDEAIGRRQDALGWKLSGAGGGGYLIVVSDRPIHAAVRIHVRRGNG
jgi:cytidyltransferase-like protein